MSEERKDILERLSKGEITAAEADEELQARDRKQGRRGFFASLSSCLADIDLDCTDRFLLEEELTGSIDPGPVELELMAANGGIQVEAWDSPGYRLLIKKRVKAASQQEAEEIAHGFQFAKISANRISAGDPQCEESRRRISVSLHLQLPRDCSITGQVRTANGSIKISDLTSEKLEVTSSNGSIHLADICGGPVAAKSVNGSITATGATSLKAATTNGSINLSSTVPKGDISLNTVNGSIKTAIPAEAHRAYALTASTTCGRINIQHPDLGMSAVGGFGGKHIEARSANWDKAGEKINLEFHTVNGSITIRDSGISA